jgi:hypothetical protein
MKAWKWILSFLITMHLVAVVAIPNGYSYFQYAWKDFLWPYAHTLNIAYTWQFFSPDPAAAIYYEYSGISNDEIQFTITYPDDTNRPWFRPNYSRRNSLKNIFMKYPHLNQKIFVSYYCNKYPEIEIFDITKKVVRPTTFDEAFEGRALTDDSQIVKEELGMQGCDNL